MLRLFSMVKAIKHRGPDYVSCMRINGVLGLGHARLAINDLSDSGNQPFTRVFRGNKYWIVFNGEIYNFKEIRSDLERRGYSFYTNTDTEVFLAAYSVWGTECFHRFNGMWAVAIYCEEERRLVLARDRFGVKPLYYANKNGIFSFCSELIGFKHIYKENTIISSENIAYEIMGGSLAPTEETYLDGVKQLLPGNLIVYDLESDCMKIDRWWNTLQNIKPVKIDYIEQVEVFRDLFIDACKIRGTCDVDIATALSGGLDSGSVYSTSQMLKERNSSRVTHDAFVAIFPGQDIDEEKYAMIAAGKYNGRLRYVDNSPDEVIPWIEEAMEKLEIIDPVPSTISAYMLYKNMRENGFKVSLDGHGGDELLGGYTYFVDIAKEEIANASDPTQYEMQLSNIYKASTMKQTQVVQAKSRHYDRFLKIKPNGIGLKDYFCDQGIMDRLECFDGKLNRALYNAFHTTSLPTILRNFDRAAMASGVESRAPLLDYRLVSYAFSLPFESKIGGGLSRRILRDSQRGILDDRIRLRMEKIGFISLFNQWLENRLFQKWLLDTVYSEDFRVSEIWDGKKIQEFVKSSLRSGSNEELMVIWPFLAAHYVINRLVK